MPKRGLIVLILVWSVLLLLPAFQNQTRQMFETTASNNDPYYSVHTDWTEIAKSHPENGLLALQQLQSKINPQQPGYWTDLDALMARFPDDLNLRRARLMESARPGKLVRLIYSLPDLKENQRAGKKQETGGQPNAQQRDSIVRAARIGEKQAPNDGFFPWMEAMALWNRDDETALRALERATQKTEWNDGSLENQRALLQFKNAQTPLDWQEKIAFYYGGVFPHYVLMRQLVREVTWSGIAHYRRGDKAGAYRRWDAALQAGGAFRRAESHGPNGTVISLLVAEATEKMVWQTVAVELNSPTKIKVMPGKPQPPFGDENAPDFQTKKNRLRAFEALAKRDGQGNLAAYVARENASFEAQKLGAHISDFTNELGVESPSSWVNTELWWIGRPILWLSVAGCLGLFACSIWRWRVGGAHWFSASSSQIAFFGALWLGALSLALWGRIASQMQTDMGLPDEPTVLSAASLSFGFFGNSCAPSLAIAATIALSIAFCYWQSSRETSRLQKQVLPMGKAATASAWLTMLTIVAWILVALNTLFLFVASDSEANRTFAFALWIVCAITALASTFWRIERGENSAQTRARLALLGVVCALITLGLGTSSNDNAGYAAMISFLFTLAILIYLPANSRGWRSMLPRAVATALQTLGGVAVICSVIFLLVSLAALPVRARQNHIVDDYIARGEIDWMRSQPEIRRASATVGK